MKTSSITVILASVAGLAACGGRSPSQEAADQPKMEVAAAAAYGDPGSPVAGEALGLVIHTQDAQELRHVILKQLTDRYAAEAGLVVTQVERDAYARQPATSAQDEHDRDGVAEGSATGNAATDELILRWKVNRALFAKHGGRVIRQPGAPEPIDAYRAFLEDQQRSGSFSISDGRLQAEFWRYYVDDAMHSFYPAGSEADAFRIAPWEAGTSPAG